MKKASSVILVTLATVFCIPSCKGESGGLLHDLDGDGFLTGEYDVSGTCPNIPAGGQMYTILQDGCALEFESVLGDLLGIKGCVAHDVVYTLKGCQGLVTVTGDSRTINLTCPWPNSNNTQENCTVFLDDRID